MKKISLQKYYRGFGVFWSGRKRKNILRFFILILLGNFSMLFYHAEESFFWARSTKIFVFFQSRMSEKAKRKKNRRRKFMRRPCEILNLRFRVRWEACTSFNLEWNCFNIHAIVYYECFFRTTSSFRASHSC